MDEQDRRAAPRLIFPLRGGRRMARGRGCIGVGGAHRGCSWGYVLQDDPSWPRDAARELGKACLPGLQEDIFSEDGLPVLRGKKTQR